MEEEEGRAGGKEEAEGWVAEAGWEGEGGKAREAGEREGEGQAGRGEVEVEGVISPTPELQFSTMRSQRSHSGMFPIQHYYHS